jgi:hypothetical protein
MTSNKQNNSSSNILVASASDKVLVHAVDNFSSAISIEYNSDIV